MLFLKSNFKNFSKLKKKKHSTKNYNRNLKSLVFLNDYSIHYTSQSQRNYLFLLGNSIGTMILIKNQKAIKNKRLTIIGTHFKKKNYFFRILSLILNSHFGKINSVIWHPFFENVFVSCGDDSNLNIWSVGK